MKTQSQKQSGDYHWIVCPECGVTLKSINISSHLNRSHPAMPSSERKELVKRYNPGGTGGRIGAPHKKAGNAQFMSRRKKNDILIFGTLFSVLAAIIGGYFYYEMSEPPAEEENADNPVTPYSPGTKKVAPDFSLQSASGTQISLHSQKGRVMVLHFMQILSDCHGTYFYKSDDRAGYDPAMGGYVSLTQIGTIHQFEELKAVYNNFSASKVGIYTIIIPPGCCGDPLQFSQDFKNNYTLTWNVASDTMQYDTWYKYMEYLPSDANKVFTRDPTVLVLDRDLGVAFNSGYSDSLTLSSKINSLL